MNTKFKFIFPLCLMAVSVVGGCTYASIPVTARHQSQKATVSGLRVIPLSTSSKEARTAFQHAEKSYEVNDRSGAKRYYEAAIAADSSFAQAYVGMAWLAGGDMRVQHMRHAVELSENLPEAERLWILGVQAGMGISGDATAIAAKLALTAPDDWRSHHLVGGIALWHKRDLETAHRGYKRAIQLAPERPELHHQLATVLQAMGDLKGAAKAADRYAKLAPEGPVPLDTKARILLEAGKLEEAEQALRAAMALDPDYVGEDGIAMIQLYQGNTRGALATLEQAVDKRPSSLSPNESLLTNMELREHLIWTYVLAEQPLQVETAIDEFERTLENASIKVYRPKIRAQLLRAQIRVSKGDWSEANALIDAALAIIKDDVSAANGSLSSADRLRHSFHLLKLRTALGMDDEAAALGLLKMIGTSAEASLLMAHYKNDEAAVLGYLEEAKGDPVLYNEAQLLAADVLQHVGKTEQATQMRTSVAEHFGHSPRFLLFRHRARCALDLADDCLEQN